MTEFGLSRTEFFFDYTIPQLFLLITSRSERNETDEEKDKDQEYAGLAEMENFASRFGGRAL